MKSTFLIAGILGTPFCVASATMGVIALSHTTGAFGYAIGLVVSVMLVVVLLNSRGIQRKGDAFHRAFRVPWAAAFGLLGWFVLANTMRMSLRVVAQGDSTLEVMVTSFICCVITLLLVSAPILVSYMLPDYSDSGD